ncbi:MAG TPA: TIGR03915 family putative DNA repair protein [Oscillospiraceae bacterium]|nr:TIGR03915 family putative DNA repair protein [Oscillospiraceae bacterium]
MTQFTYRYDGSFSGFLCCIFDSYVNREEPAHIFPPEEARLTLFEERRIVSDEAHAARVHRSLALRISPAAQKLVERGFCTCAPEREMLLYRFIRLGYEKGGAVLAALSHPDVAPLLEADRHMGGELQLLRGFVRFSELGGVLVSEIEPKNRVLPYLAPHFRARLPRERFLIYDRTHREACVSEPGRWAILPLEEFRMAAPDAREAAYRRLWRNFYDTVAITERYNPKCRMTHMPKRYWACMTEFQGEASAPLPPENAAVSLRPAAPAATPGPATRPGPARRAPA